MQLTFIQVVEKLAELKLTPFEAGTNANGKAVTFPPVSHILELESVRVVSWRLHKSEDGNSVTISLLDEDGFKDETTISTTDDQYNWTLTQRVTIWV